jgi:ssDNA-binding Zn-finger/Zn-ribbon topoisomerase 1
MNCPNCNETIADALIFLPCPYCGHELTKPDENKEDEDFMDDMIILDE